MIQRKQAPPSVSGIVDQLEREVRKLKEQRDTTLRTVHHIEAEIRKVEQAIGALTGKDLHGSDGRRKGLSGIEVTALIERVLQEEGRMTEPRLRERLAERASAEGRSRAGLHLRFERALQDGPFRFNGAHWELRNWS